MTHPLWPRMNAALNRLELMSEAPAANPSPSAGGKPGSKILTQQGIAERDYWLAQWHRPHNPYRTRLEVVEAVEKALRPRPLSVVKDETQAERDKRILMAENTGWSPVDVARGRWGHITPRMVVQARKAAGLDPETGKPWMESESAEAKARRLRASGLSVRAVAQMTGLGLATVHRIGKRAA